MQVIKRSEMPIVVMKQGNSCGAKGHCFKQCFLRKEYFQIGGKPTNETETLTK